MGDTMRDGYIDSAIFDLRSQIEELKELERIPHR